MEMEYEATSPNLGASQSINGKKTFAYTQGVSDNWFNEVIHVSLDKVNRINRFMDRYDVNGREVEPEVIPAAAIANSGQETRPVGTPTARARLQSVRMRSVYLLVAPVPSQKGPLQVSASGQDGVPAALRSARVRTLRRVLQPQ